MGRYRIIGVMSGSSLDGLDVAFCELSDDGGSWSYTINQAETIPFPPKWKLRLEKLVLQNAVTYIKTHTFLGHYMGEVIKDFIDRHGIADQVDFIASHGQTIFHQPDNHFTSQIGDGAAIAAKTGFPVICDFRTTDVALNGQGTPIAPAANKYLFPQYKYFLNLGGIANIAVNTGDKYVAFDVVPSNFMMNELAGRLGKEFDEDGNAARTGKVNADLLEELNNSWYYGKEYPKSLSGGWINKVMGPVMKKYRIPVEDKLRTLCELIGIQLANAFKMVEQTEGIQISTGETLYVTGGGAYNKFLIECIEAHVPLKVLVPDSQTVAFKEAALMALMGALRVTNQVNCFSSVTGADQDTIGGCIYQGTHKLLDIK